MDLRPLLSAGAVLLGLDAASNSKTTLGRSDSQSELLKRRLVHLSTRIRPLSLFEIDHSLPDDLEAYAQGSLIDDSTSKNLTARSALALLSGINLAVSIQLRQLLPTQEAPPILGARDVKVVGQLGAVFARWGLAASVHPGIIAPSLRDDGLAKIQSTPAASTSTIHDANSAIPLKLATSTLTRIVLPKDGPSCSRYALSDPLPPLILPQVLPSLLAALIQLGWERSPDSKVLCEDESAQQARQDALRLVNQYVFLNEPSPRDLSPYFIFCSVNVTSAFSALFTLYPRKGGRQEPPRWFPPALMNLLGVVLSRESGVRGILSYITDDGDKGRAFFFPFVPVATPFRSHL
jgi:hypothetical protein